ncbi:MAG: hypothetical protein ACRESZ_12210 [Methylococcales bacterium]
MKKKVNFKQAILAGGALAALSLGSMPARAMILSDVGEAHLVPFVLADSTPVCIPGSVVPPLCPGGAGGAGPSGPFSINTAVKITVPKSVGNDTIPHFFTAIWTTPTNGPNCTPPGSFTFTGCEDPGDPDLVPSNQVSWFFLDRTSVHRLNGNIRVTPDDVAVIDWGVTLRQNGAQSLDGVPGYLVLTTRAGGLGRVADFSFFAEAWVFLGIDISIAPPNNTGGTFGLVDALIPTLAMNDGADTLGNLTPTITNQVIELNRNGNVIASPLYSGIRTNWSDGIPLDITVLDLTLGNRSVRIGATTNLLQFPTLMVVWNDRNAGARWSGLGVDVFNDREESCSDSIDLPFQLNLYWVQTDVTAGLVPPFVTFPVPRFIQRFGFNRTFCVPLEQPDGNNLERLLSGGFMKLYLPELVDNNLNRPESSMVAFSIPLQYFATVENAGAGGGPVLTDISLIPFETALGHERGKFNIAP